MLLFDVTNNDPLNFSTWISVLWQESGTLAPQKLRDLTLSISLIEFPRVGTSMHHILVVREIISFCHYIGNYRRMLRKECLIIDFFPLELFSKLGERFNAVINRFAARCLDRLAGTLRRLLYRNSHSWEAEVLKMETPNKV